MWILVANRAYAEIFELKGKQMKIIDFIEYPEGRLKPSEIVSDKPGRTTSGSEKHALSEGQEVAYHEEELFAHQLAVKCYHAKLSNLFDKLTIVASPDFLGTLRQKLNKHIKPSILKEIPRNLSLDLPKNKKVEQLFQYLAS